MTAAEPDPDDTASLRRAAQLPLALMVVGAAPELASQGEALSLEGYNVVWVVTMAQALAQHELEPCSVILVANRLPDGTCAELTASIRAQSHSSYAYLIAQVADETSVGLDVDDWVGLSASCADLMTHLRAARRIVTMERSCRVGNEHARLRTLVDHQFGIGSRQFFLSEAIRRLAKLQRHDLSMVLLLVRAEVEEECIEHLADIANMLLDVGRRYNGVVARLSPVTFGLLMVGVDERAAAEAQLQTTRRLSQVHTGFSCGAAVVNGPVSEPHECFTAMNLAAERTLQPIASAARREFEHAVGA